MPLNLTNGDVLEIRSYTSNADGQIATTIFHILVTNVLEDEISYQNLADGIASTIGPSWKSCIPPTCSWDGVQVRRIFPTPTPITPSAVAAGAGTVTGDALPGQVSGQVELVTDIPGRGHRGRMYFPFPSETDNDADGNPASTWWGRVSNAIIYMDTITTFVDPEGGGMFEGRGVVWSKKRGGYDVISNKRPATRWARQSRRTGNRRPDKLPSGLI